MKSALLLLISLTLVSNAQVELKWEYRPVAETFLGPNPQPNGDPLTSGSEIFISRYLTSPSGYTLLSVEGRWKSVMEETEKLILLDPQGNEVWMSADLGAMFSGPVGISIRLIHAGPDAAVASVSESSDFGSGNLVIYNKHANPQMNVLTLSGESFSKGSSTMNDDPSRAFQTAGFNGSTLYSLVKDPDAGPIGGDFIALKKYALTLSNQPEIVIPNESGVENKNLVLRWQSAVGVRYQIQQSTNLSLWEEVGQPVDGTGAVLSWSQAVSLPAKFFRVVQR
ncbi:hypothetical protein OVA24_14335 [Luteolibacter sp. SL250]|uniref:hypothetical protein n=1 Tax=Luteolibacter sp. SL250 TaxID=2995170 RepID=UPI002270DD2C|nr:hypothetical protein [Luteolibacter sp. SL250]WAC18409.1 hypothetical protein OVA24_14335 [Luteolibacter sp. SL250]